MPALHRFPRPRVNASDVPLPYCHFVVRRGITAKWGCLMQRKRKGTGVRASRANCFGSSRGELSPDPALTPVWPSVLSGGGPRQSPAAFHPQVDEVVMPWSWLAG